MSIPKSQLCLSGYLKLAFLLLGIYLEGDVAGETWVWLEGEAGQANCAVNAAGWGRPHFLSEGKWLHVSVDQGKVDSDVPAEGIVIKYDVSVNEAGSYEVWNRIGFEFVRSVFEWRVDDGAWQAIEPDVLTTDLMELSEWCEVAWLKMGEVRLSGGGHRLEIRLAKTKDAEGKWRRILYASDALCLYRGAFHPNSKYKPGDAYQDDQDKEASEVVFQAPEVAAGKRAEVVLSGLWEIARDDEQLPGEVAEPIEALPEVAYWHAIKVPGDKNGLRDDLIFAHRVWYRTKVNVPKSLAGRQFYLEFPCNNLNTTVYVNGVYCGFEKNPFVRFKIDLSKGIKPGETNEIWVGIRDAWYGRTADPERPMKLRRTFNLPMRFFSEGFQDLDYPVWNCPQSGIMGTPALIVCGGEVAIEDVFVKPSVANHRLEAELTLHNGGKRNVSGEIRWEAVDEKTGKVARLFKPQGFQLAAGKSAMVTLSDGWADAMLWWPDRPQLYRLRATVSIGERPVDSNETLFGFREWRCEGKKFTLNGVVWHMWADLVGVNSSPEDWLAAYRRTNQRTMRMSTAGQAGHETRWMGLEPEQALEFCDRNGVVVRRNTTLDGERIGYNFVEKDQEIIRKQDGSELKLALMKNWRDQCVAQVKGERNHPSIQIWTIENEFAYINLINLLGHSPNMDKYEREIALTHDAVMAVDPTRSVMIDGGGALKDNSLGVHGDHYVATLDSRYPDLAYEPFVEGGGRGRWLWDEKRPRFLGEDWYATGINPADYAMWGGEVTFQGKAATRDAVALIYRMLNEGYRWGGYYGAWQFWLGGEGGEKQWGANYPRAVFVRQWDWTFGSGQAISRTFGIFNDTQYADPITFNRKLVIDGKEVYTKSTIHRVAPGTAEKFDEMIAMPKVTTRQNGELRLSLVVKGEEVFSDVKSVSVLPEPKGDGLADYGLAVFDPSEGVIHYLKQLGIDFKTVTELNQLPADVKALVVGPDAIDADQTTSTLLAAFASQGKAVIVLDQQHPLKYQALPAEIELANVTKKNDFGTEIPTARGSTAFIEDASHPALMGLENRDFFTWGPDHRVYRNVYVKPTKGGKSLVQCGPRLANTALTEIPVGQGVMYLCQLDLGAKLANNVVARHLLRNLIQAGQRYRLEYAQVATVIDNEPFSQALDAVGLQYSKAANPLAAIRDGQNQIAIVTAQADRLKMLAGNSAALQQFWDGGGTLILCGVTPEGLNDFNTIVGVNHVMRPFKRERVTFPQKKNPLTSGLGVGDIVLLSGERIFGWTKDEYVVSDMFNYVVDLDDVAPFAKSNFHSYANIVNGFVGSDGWPLIIDFEYPQDGKPYEIQMDLPYETVIAEYTHDQSVNYNPTTRIALLFDGKDKLEFEVSPDGEAQSFAIDPTRTAHRVTLQLLEWQKNPGKRPIVGIDNIALKIKRPESWQATVAPMLNVGGLVEYRKGKGRVILCNLNIKENEAVPVNVVKKRTILATILRNLKAPFAGTKTVIAGGNLRYVPLDIHTRATTYKDERGWFGDKAFTFKSLPAGEHEFAGVLYQIYEMPTSPVPQVLMLGGPKVPGNLPEQITGIPVGVKADALFFLHTARIDRRRNNREQSENQRFEMFKYVIHYADGQTEELPIYQEIDVDHYRQREPQALPGAQIAWMNPYERGDESAVLYAKQWNNPRPDVVIQSVDLIYGKDKDRGVPALLAITAASVNE